MSKREIYAPGWKSRDKVSAAKSDSTILFGFIVLLFLTKQDAVDTARAFIAKPSPD